MVTNH